MDIAGQPNQYRFQMDRPLNNRHETVDDFEYSSPCLPDGEAYVVRKVGRFVAEPAYTHKKDDPGVVYIQSLNRDVAEFYDVQDRQRESKFQGCVKTDDTTALEPDVKEHKYYCPGIGVVLGENIKDGTRAELVEMTMN